MSGSLSFLLPEILLSVGAMVLLVLDLFPGRRLRPMVVIASILFLAIALSALILNPFSGRALGMFVLDPFSAFFKFVAILGGFLIVLVSEDDPELLNSYPGTYLALILLSVVGTMFLSSAEDLLILFVGLELTTIPLFILAGFLRKNLSSSEAAIKFFLVGAFSTGLMLYGISILYGLCGSTHFKAIQHWFLETSGSGVSVLFVLGVLFILVGLGFKLSLVPFHQWTPDAYEGAPTPVTAFFSVSREAGVIAVMLRFFSEFVNLKMLGMTDSFMVLSILTMTVGNLLALKQNSLKRLLAYSSIAHAGTIFIGVVSGNLLGRQGAMLYSFTYFLMSLGAFAVVIMISRIRGKDDIESVQGLAKENFPLACLMLISILSLSGIPPLLGFWGKFYVFMAAIEAKMFWLVGIGLLNSVVAVYYYFRIIHKMFFQEPLAFEIPIERKIRQPSAQFASFFAVGCLLLLGIFPQKLLALVQLASHFLP